MKTVFLPETWEPEIKTIGKVRTEREVKRVLLGGDLVLEEGRTLKETDLKTKKEKAPGFHYIVLYKKGSDDDLCGIEWLESVLAYGVSADVPGKPQGVNTQWVEDKGKALEMFNRELAGYGYAFNEGVEVKPMGVLGQVLLASFL